MDGGQVIMPLTATFFSPRLGMTTDLRGATLRDPEDDRVQLLQPIRA